MYLQYRHNGGYDSVLLVDLGVVRSDWTVTRQVMEDFADLTSNPDNWDDRGGEDHRPDEYGVLVATRRGHTIEVHNDSMWNERVAFFCRGPKSC